MIQINSLNARLWSKLGQRSTFGITMIELGRDIDNLVVLTADLCSTSGLDRFRALYPDKLLNVGIAEQNLLGIAAGLAKEGRLVFATTFATFAAMRSYEQVRLNLGYMGFNIKLVGLGSGFGMGMFGNTHYGIEDVALMRAIPGLCIISPADCTEVVKATEAIARYHGPVYLRLTGVANNPVVNREDYPFEIGKAITLKKGSDVTIIATGSMVYHALEAAKILESREISASVVNMHTIKPLDTEAIDTACTGPNLIVTVEEHSVIGGLGGAVAEYLCARPSAPRQLIIGMPDAFQVAGDYQYLLDQNGLTGPHIAERIASAFNTRAHST
ncbi:transketolase C-terminal domain-containing protein [uncultured Methanoregula sp.]|uniref:transketolase family protein n=1 Tax=uncultured Methanoregula sp. TaxID=1005933 RepID=UPI002AAAAE54|nr:transketolase C-terminal domain-containing protein [uncultured Methanoregula sp.]